MTIKDKIRKLQAVRGRVSVEFDSIVMKNEHKIIRMNASQFEDGRGSDGQALINSNPLFTGRYQLLTVFMAQERRPVAPKVVGELYNFAWTGDFLSNMVVESKKNKIKIYSTGTGSGEKAAFFNGYKNLFGLDDENMRKLNNEIIMPELKKFIKQNI